MKITSKGQVTIPNEFRHKYGLLPHMEVEFKERKGNLCLIRAKKGPGDARGEQIIRRMRAAKTLKMTTEEIMAVTRGYRKDDK